MQKISSMGSERATNDSGKIITCHGRTHIAWQDVSREGYFNRVRTYDHAMGSWGEPVTLDVGIDNHARGVLAIDNHGVLHAVLGGHGTAVHWRRALAPDDASAWSAAVPVGVGTYPVFLCGPDGTLYLTLRGRGQQRHQRGVDLYRLSPGESAWSEPRRIVALAESYGQAYAAYHMQMDAAPDGTLHAIIDFYEGEDAHGRGLHQATCYARSTDGGDCWTRADGKRVPLPARPENLDVLARSIRPRHEKLPPPEIRQGGMVVDARGRAFAFYLDHGAAPGRCMMVTVEDGGLRQTPVSQHWERLYPEMRALECRAAVREDDAIFVLVTLTPFNDEWLDGKPTRAMRMCERSDQRLVWLVSRDGGATFTVETFLTPGQACNCPSGEKSVGINTIPADRPPAVLYFDGSQEYPGGGDYYESGRSVGEILAAGGFRANNVLLAGL